MVSRLTILLPLKGRPLHTLRFLWHAERCRLPYRFLIADGQVHPSLARLLESSAAVFPNLDITYIRYPDDASFSEFYLKMANAAARVTTPYVMQVDNDDFIMRAGLDWCMDFLDAHANYTSCGAGIGGFSLGAAPEPGLADIAGPMERLSFRYGPHYEPRDLSEASAEQRFAACGTHFAPAYYSVFRSEALATVTREIAEIDFSDLELHEAFFCMRMLTLGALRSEGAAIAYLRQRGTTSASAYRGRDWVAHFLESNFSRDFDMMAARIAAAVAEHDGDANACAAQIRDIYAEKLRGDLRERYRAVPAVRPAHHPLSFIKVAMQAWGLGSVLRLYRDVSERRLQARKAGPGIALEIEQVCARLRACGASSEGVIRFRGELMEIEQTLTASEFVTFLRRHASEFLSSGASQAAQCEVVA